MFLEKRRRQKIPLTNILFKLSFESFAFFRKSSIMNRNRNYNFYEVLGVERTCNNEEIKSAYLKLAKQYHPDVNNDPGAEDKFKSITLAYEALSNQKNRDLYDAYMNNDPYSQEWKFKEEHYRDYEKEDSAKRFYRERSRQDQYSHSYYQHYNQSNFWEGSRDDFENDFYSSFSKGYRQQQARKAPQKGEDILLEIKISLYDSNKGVDKGVKFTRRGKCHGCNGTMSAKGSRPSKCFNCEGVGEVKTTMFNSKKCGQCKGIGYIVKYPCK